MSTRIITATIFAAAAALAAVPVDWRCDVAASNPRQIQAFRGETLQLSCTFLRGGKPIAGAMQTATFCWQTNGMSFWQQTNAVVAGAAVSAEFTPAMDWGADRYRFFFGARDAAGLSYRANGYIAFADSPGATPGSAPPLPGTVWNLSDVTVIGAPWATLDEIDAGLEGYATTQDVAAVAAAIPSLEEYATTSNVSAQIAASASAERAATDADIAAAASNAIAAAVAQIPSLAGYATESYVQDAIGDIEMPDLAGYATEAYADAAASNAQAAAVAQIPSLAGYATESYVQDAIGDIEMPDLAGYATEAYADAAASNAQAAAVAQIPSLAGYATESYVQDAIGDIEMPSLAGYATEAYVDTALTNFIGMADNRYLQSVPIAYATKSWVLDQVETSGGEYAAGVWSGGYVLDATGVVSAATIITNAIPTPPYMTNTTIIIDGGVTTTVETVTTNYTYEVVTNLAPAFKAFLYDASTSPESAIADAALTGPVFYSDSSRHFFRVSDVLYECDDGTRLEYSNGRWRYSDGVNTYDCINGNGLPAEDMSPPPAILQWRQGGTWEMVTRGSVLETFPLLYNRAGLGGADYETVSNRAMSAVQPDSLSSACSAATNYTDAATNALAHDIAAQSALSAPVLYLADDGRIFNRVSDTLYACADGAYLDYSYPYTPDPDTEGTIWRYNLTNGSYVFCEDAQGRPATNPAPPSVIKWVEWGGAEVSATLKSVLSAFPLYAPAADLAAATNAVYTVLDGLPDMGSVLATNASGYVDKSVKGLFFTSEWDASPQNVKLWQPQMDWLEINFLGMGGYRFTLPSTSGIAPYEPWMVQYAPDLVMRWVDVTNEIAGIDYEARVGEVLTNRLGAVSIGYHAKASAGGFGAVAIGSNTTATANCAVAIGANSDATATAGIAIGCDAGASGANGIAVGLGAAATAQKGIAIGQGAKAYASSAVQIGTGSNSAEETVNFYGVCVFSNGTLVVGGGGGGTPEEISVTDTVPYSKGLVNLTVTSGGTLACNTNGWANGAQVMVNATLPAAYTAASGVEPVGYSSMPTDGQYLLVFTRIWGKVYVSVITSEE